MRPALLFDLDGTLVDSLLDIRESMNASLAARGFPPVSLARYRELIGGGVRDLAAQAAGTQDRGVIDALVAGFTTHYDAHLVEATAPYAGVPALLASLRARGVSLGVLSNKPHAATQSIVERLFPGVFDDVRGHVEGTAKKPDASTLTAQCDRLGVERTHALFVGDSEVDVATARNADVRCVAVTYGYRDAEALSAADALAEDVPGLARAIDRWLVVLGLPGSQYRAP